MVLLGHAGDWVPLVTLLAMFVLVVGALLVDGRSDAHDSRLARVLVRIPESLERALSIPGWAAATVATSLFGLMLAGVGLYADIAWHVDLGRDEQLFTAPHTMIVIGLGLIAAAAVVGVVFASLTDGPGMRWRGVRVPYSTVLLATMGVGALAGFPLDEWWHRVYGIDVTLWSPTHLLMVCGGALSPLACWLVLAEARVRPTDGLPARAAHITVGSFLLIGVTALQGEFAFGVPQFQQLYHPALVIGTASVLFVAARAAIGPGGALAIWAGAALLWIAPLVLGQAQMGANPGFSEPRPPLYLTAAAGVELAALLVGTKRPLRFAAAATVAVLTVGLAGEWAWNTGARQPWTSALLPDALLVGGVVAAGGAVLGLLLAAAATARRPGVPAALGVAAAAAVVVGLAIPLPRQSGDVHATLTLDWRTADLAVVEVALDPPEAADGARWFQVMSWQGGGLVLSPLRETAPGRYVSERPLPVTGSWKTMVRLHRGAELLAVPVFLPADPEIGAPQIPAVDRSGPMVGEAQGRLLLREQRDGPPSPRVFVLLLVAVVVAAWVASGIVAARRAARHEDEPPAPRREPVLAGPVPQ